MEYVGAVGGVVALYRAGGRGACGSLSGRRVQRIGARGCRLALHGRAVVAKKASKKIGKKTGRKPAKDPASEEAAGPVLLSGGNPQIAKADGDAPVRAYIEAMPGWKRDVGRRLDALIVETVPGVRKAVRWNTPFYGVEGRGWFVAFHCITKYVKVSFFRGTSLRPEPPVGSKQPEVRYLHIHEDDEIDEALVRGWIRQASEMDGERCF